MTSYADALERLRRQGCRLTPQRLLILSVIAGGDGHMGVDEVLRKARESYPYMDITTIYRTLHLFKDMGVATEVVMGDRLHYEMTDRGRRHHHMVCRACGRAFDLSPRYLEEFSRKLADEFGFTPDVENFTVSGVCADCRAKGTT